MRYSRSVSLKDGSSCLIRSAEGGDAEEVLRVFNATHAETDFLLTYPDEGTRDVEQEREFLLRAKGDERSVYLCALIGERLAGTAGINPVNPKEKTRHRAELGIAVLEAYWGRGIGRALLQACVKAARKAQYSQLELDVVADNARALSLYGSLGFKEYGRNPRGLKSRLGSWQELVLMRLELE